jgi:hypothetical protein
MHFTSLPNPFPVKLPDGRTVIDEVCVCGLSLPQSHTLDRVAARDG